MKVGVLALQGGVVEHINAIRKLNHEGVIVKKKEDLEGLDAIILPGGESTTMGKLLKITELDKEIIERVNKGLKVWGTCAGLILLATDIGEEKAHLKLLDIKVKRNGFGTQIDSFKEFKVIDQIDNKPIELVFIRAPFIEECGEGVEILCKVRDKIVAAKKDNILVTAFHPELTDDIRILKYFLENKM